MCSPICILEQTHQLPYLLILYYHHLLILQLTRLHIQQLMLVVVILNMMLLIRGGTGSGREFATGYLPAGGVGRGVLRLRGKGLGVYVDSEGFTRDVVHYFNFEGDLPEEFNKLTLHTPTELPVVSGLSLQAILPELHLIVEHLGLQTRSLLLAAGS